MSLEGFVIGNYRLINHLGGGLGDVYLAENTHVTHKLVAIKFIRATRVAVPENQPTLVGSDNSYVRETMNLSRREANAIAMLEHPHILPLFDCGEIGIDGVNTPYLVMEYRKEGTLARWITQHSANRTLTLPEMVHFLHQAAEALQFAHDRNIIHQDVKPANFLIRHTRGGSLPDILLADFGLATFVNPDPNSSSPYIITDPHKGVSAIVRGTPYYMPPEQWEGKPVFATDQYALAVMTYQLITGRLPFQGSLADLMSIHATAMPQPPSAINPAIPGAVDAVILKALQKQPPQRYPNITAFASAFADAVNNAVNLSQQQTAGRPPVHHSSFSPRKIALMLIALVLICLLGAGIPIFAAAQSAAQSKARATATAISAEKTAAIVSLNATHTAATAIVQQHATATAIATQATAVAIVGATATAVAIANHYDPYPPHFGPPIIFNSLFAPSKSNTWDTSSDTSGGCQFANVSYEDSASQSGGSRICTDGQSNFSNFTFQIDMTIRQGDCGGIVFNYQKPTMFYRFKLCEDGSYTVARTDESGTHYLTGGTTTLILPRNQLNRIALIDDQGTVSVYLRGQLLVPNIQDSFFSPTHPTSGLLGVIAVSNPKTATTSVDYRNELVWKM